jgi:hypothetical protein
VSVQRFLLILAVLCVVGTALVFPATASAHTNTQLSQQQQSVATDQSEYYFYASGWGWGYCFNHNTIQSLGNGAGHLPNAMAIVIGALYKNPWAGVAATVALEGMRWYLEAIDRGNGDCIAFVGGSPALPFAWARK